MKTETPEQKAVRIHDKRWLTENERVRAKAARIARAEGVALRIKRVKERKAKRLETSVIEKPIKTKPTEAEKRHYAKVAKRKSPKSVATKLKKTKSLTKGKTQ
jgi:hypothetical protein